MCIRDRDYGGLEVFGQPEVEIESSKYTFKSYRITKNEEQADRGVAVNGDTITISRAGYEITLQKCTKC